MSKLYARSDIVDGQCGIGTLRTFVSEKYVMREEREDAYGTVRVIYMSPHRSHVFPLDEVKHLGGCDFVGTGFINTPVSKESYEWLCEKKRLIFQTPVRKNKNSGRNFFYAMFDDLNNVEEVGHLPTLRPNWPF